MKLTKKHVIIPSVILLLLLVLALGCYMSIRLYVNQFIKNNYDRRVSVWQNTAANLPDDCIVFIGDSHTEYFLLDEYFP